MNREQVIERLKQIKTNLPNYPMDAIADITFLLERLTGFCEFITNPEDCDSIYVEALKRGNKDLVEENTRLQAQLNKEIHYNRIMKRALEKYADLSNWFICYLRHHYIFQKDNYKANELAKEILKQIEEME